MNRDLCSLCVESSSGSYSTRCDPEAKPDEPDHASNERDSGLPRNAGRRTRCSQKHARRLSPRSRGCRGFFQPARVSRYRHHRCPAALPRSSRQNRHESQLRPAQNLRLAPIFPFSLRRKPPPRRSDHPDLRPEARTSPAQNPHHRHGHRPAHRSRTPDSRPHKYTGPDPPRDPPFRTSGTALRHRPARLRACVPACKRRACLGKSPRNQRQRRPRAPRSPHQQSAGGHFRLPRAKGSESPQKPLALSI